MREEGLKVYLFLLQGGDNKKLTDSYAAVKQAHINETIAKSTERVNDYGVLFTSDLDWISVNEKLGMKDGEHYLLIELKDSDSISGVFPDTGIEEIKSLNLDNLSDSAEWLKREIDKAVDNDNFEVAAKLLKKLEQNKKDSL